MVNSEHPLQEDEDDEALVLESVAVELHAMEGDIALLAAAKFHDIALEDAGVEEETELVLESNDGGDDVLHVAEQLAGVASIL